MQDENKSKSILLVDDDADDRKYFLEAVKEIDPAIVVSIARDGKEALAVLTSADSTLPDYIFLDLRMPKVNGKQFLLEVKKNEQFKAIPVIIYTTSREVEESHEMHDLGAVHFVSKPSDPEEIYYVLSQVLDGEWNEQSWRTGKP